MDPEIITEAWEFQSALPSRGATLSIVQVGIDHKISIHAPLEGSDGMNETMTKIGDISTRAPLAGSDHGPGLV